MPTAKGLFARAGSTLRMMSPGVGGPSLRTSPSFDERMNFSGLASMKTGSYVRGILHQRREYDYRELLREVVNPHTKDFGVGGKGLKPTSAK